MAGRGLRCRCRRDGHACVASAVMPHLHKKLVLTAMIVVVGMLVVELAAGELQLCV